jgi:YD repeat-containing protein
VTHVTSANSSATQFNYTDLTYDAANNLQSVTSSYWDAASGSNKTVSRVAYAYESWSGGNRLRTVTVDLTPDITADSKTYVTSYTYASGTSTLLAGLTQSDGTSLAFTYNVDGKLDSIRDALGQTTSYAYDTAHSRTSITDALGNVTVYGYDASGRVASVTTPAVGGVSAVTSYAWDTGGNLIAITDGEGKTTAMQYDDNGNLLLQRDGAGNTVTSSFDANNQLLTQTVYLVPDPDGDGAASAGTPLTTRYVYDAGGKSQLRFVISAEGRVTEYRYDGYGQRISSIQYRGNAYAGAAFAESDLQAWVGAAETDKTQSQRTDYAWDFRGQLASSTTWGSVDAGGIGVAGTDTTTRFVYGPDGRLLSTIDPLGGAGQTTSYTYDGLGRVLTATNGLGQVTSSVYDDAGNRTTITAANGLVAVNTYDAAGRRLSVQESGTAVSAQTRYYYDADNQLRMTRDANGVASWRLYDANGRKVGDIDGNGSLTEYIYDQVA